MRLQRLFSADAGLSVLLHALKALVALLLNWIVLHYLAVDDFVVWSVTSSILIVATASDLGIGQYTVTKLIAAEDDDWPRYVGRGVGALLPLALLSGLFVFFMIEGPSPGYRATMAALLALRIFTLPYVAVLHAKNQFKIRKALELAAYLVAVVLVAAIAVGGAGVHAALVALNLTFLLGFSAMVGAAGRYVSLRTSLHWISPVRSMEVFRAALPFTVNNITGLLTYGGFIWLCSLILPREEVAKLAVLHTFVLMNLYQIYDVFLKARQAELADTASLPPFRRLNTVLMISVPPAFLLVGREALAWLSGSQLRLSPLEAGLYGLFVAFELGNLFVQSITQVNLAHASLLKSYSAVRASMIAAFLLVGQLPIGSEDKLLALLSFLTAVSLISFLYLQRSGSKVGLTGPRFVGANAAIEYGEHRDEL